MSKKKKKKQPISKENFQKSLRKSEELFLKMVSKSYKKVWLL